MILKFCAETPVVKGFNRSCIYDLPRRTYDFVPNDVLSKLMSLENHEQSIVESQLDEDEQSWLDLFIEKEYCFYIPEAFMDCFPKIDFTWKNPSKITNAIIDISDLNICFDFQALENLNCKHIVIRFKNVADIDEIFTFLEKQLKDLTFKSVDVRIEKDIRFKMKWYHALKNKIEKELLMISSVAITRKEVIKKGKRFRPNFIVEIATFAEAQKNNLYFNRKLHIDLAGNIKNGIELKTHFSSIHETSIEKIVDSSAFQKIGKMHKDSIDVCKDCEFRYMCVDNRIPITRKDKSAYFTNECAYNPYISLWNTDENFLGLKQIGVKSNANGFSYDEEKIKQINANIWSE